MASRRSELTHRPGDAPLLWRTHHFISLDWHDQDAKRSEHKARFFLTLLVFIVILFDAARTETYQQGWRRALHK